MARTRSGKAAPAKSKDTKDVDTSNTRSRFELESTPGESPKLFILPSQATNEARIVNLPHPRHSQPSRYLVCPQSGVYEFTKIAAHKATPRSWLLEATKGSDAKSGTTMGSDLFVATVIDPLFLILPALAESRPLEDAGEQQGLFLSSDDHFDKLPQDHSHMAEILRWRATRNLFEARMEAVCDTVEAGDESMFRLSEKKLSIVMLDKAQRMSQGSLPVSVEEKFIKRALEAPLMQRKLEVTDVKKLNIDADSEAPDSQTGSAISRSSSSMAHTDASLVSQPSTAATSFKEETIEETLVSAMEASPEVVHLQRLRIALDFICSSYLKQSLADRVKQLLTAGGADLVDFTPLNEYLTSLERLRSEMMATTSTADFSRRRRRDEEEEDDRQEKKRKLEEAKKKKANESKALRDLKRVDTKGMKKMSDFFKKK